QEIELLDFKPKEFVSNIENVIKKKKKKKSQEGTPFFTVYRTEDHHILNVKEESFPEKYRELIRRLQKAANKPEIRNTMDVEDEIIEELGEKEREIAIKDVIIEESKKTIEENKKQLAEKDKQIEALKRRLKGE
ncbi:MAG: hypothetical protein KJ607_06600, partial [Bacteroidetes bacterium]|nr:hypothetical protein [Bacteroidota bacterium]